MPTNTAPGMKMELLKVTAREVNVYCSVLLINDFDISWKMEVCFFYDSGVGSGNE